MSTIAPQFEAPEIAPEPEPQRPGQVVQARLSTKQRIALAMLALWVLSGVYIVLPDQQAVETLFGKVIAPRVMPGLHYALPWPIELVTRIKVRQLQRLEVGGGLPDTVTGRSQPLLSQFVTGDQNIIHVRVVVQYSVGSPLDYLFQSQDPARLVGAAVESEVARRIAHRTVDDVLTIGKAAIQEETQAAAQSLLNGYRAGVQLSSINIESVAPPPEAAGAFRDVAGARADAARIVNDSQGYANDLLPKARGQAHQMLQEAQGYRQKKIDEAGGDAARFNQMAAEYSKAAQVTRRRLYLETMEQVLPRIKKLVVDENGNLDLTIIRKGDGPVK